MKNYFDNAPIGKVRHSVSFHNGVKTHDDGSPFYDLKTFTRKKDKDAFILTLQGDGYREGPADPEPALAALPAPVRDVLQRVVDHFAADPETADRDLWSDVQELLGVTPQEYKSLTVGDIRQDGDQFRFLQEDDDMPWEPVEASYGYPLNNTDLSRKEYRRPI